MAEAKHAKRETRTEIKRLVDLVQRQVDDGATSVEEIHLAIANLPLDVLERLDVFEETVEGVRKIQEARIGAIYDVIRKVNDRVGKFAKEILAEPAARKAAAKPARRPAPKAAHGKAAHAPAR